jgi:hypothetical protein
MTDLTPIPRRFLFWVILVSCEEVRTTKWFMISHSPTDNEITLTLALSHQNGRGNFSIQGATQCEPSPACGRGKGEGLVLVEHRIFQGGHEEHEGTEMFPQRAERI